VLETVPLPWSEPARRTWREVVDGVLGLAAQLSYYFFLALSPAILLLLALAASFRSSITDDVGRSLGPFVSPRVVELIQEPSADREAHDGGAIDRAAKIMAILGRTNRAWDDAGRPVSFEEGRSAL
jgi:membrane protein